MPHDTFQLRHAGEIREALIMLEGDSGAFELLTHGSLPSGVDADDTLYAVVRSGGSNRVYVLVQAEDPVRPHVPQWREIAAADLPQPA